MRRLTWPSQLPWPRVSPLELRGGSFRRAIARELGLARNTVLKYLNAPGAIQPKPRRARGSKLDPYAQHIDRRMADGLENCVRRSCTRSSSTATRPVCRPSTPSC